MGRNAHQERNSNDHIYEEDAEEVISPGLKKLKKRLRKMDKGARNYRGVEVEDDGLYPIQQDDDIY